VILVAGGTGRLGTLVVRRLLERGERVRVLTRRPASADHLGDEVEVAVGDLRDPASLHAAVAGVDVAVSAAHGFLGPRGTSPTTVDRDGNANRTAAAGSVGAELVLVSIVGAAADSPIELFRMKHAAEQRALASAVPTTVVRATAFLELWIELLEQTAGRSGRPLVFGKGDNPISFVSVTDVAALVDLAIHDRSTRGEVLEIGGPDALTFNELAAWVQAAAGRTGAARHLPPPMLRVVAATVGRLHPQLRRQTTTALAMDRDDMTLDPAPLQARYPQLPRTRLQDVLAVAR
jgi:NADH dehydrogenase